MQRYSIQDRNNGYHGAGASTFGNKAQIASGIDIIVRNFGRMRDKSRKVLEIAEINGIKDGEIMLNSIFKFKETESKDEYVKSNKVTGELKK